MTNPHPAPLVPAEAVRAAIDAGEAYWANPANLSQCSECGGSGSGHDFAEDSTCLICGGRGWVGAGSTEGAEAAALAAALPLILAAQWRPIKTAPRDGTWILVVVQGLYKDGVPFIPAVARWTDGGWLEDPADDHGGDAGYLPATHWMPLPPPPRAAAESQGEERDNG